jgi:hypothetical protein
LKVLFKQPVTRYGLLFVSIKAINRNSKMTYSLSEEAQ